MGATAVAARKGWPELAAANRTLTGNALAVPTAEQLAWQELEIGMFIHFAPNTWRDREGDDMSTPLSEINPLSLDTDQWTEGAVSLGAKYVVFVAKHAGGFCMWQTHSTDYGIRNTSWRGGHGDVLADLYASCHKHGLKLGVYLSPHDVSQGAADGGRCKTSEEQQKYNAIYRQQLTEVLSRYGAMVEIWFDGSIIIPVDDILREYTPQAMIFEGPEATVRWVGNEDGFAPYPLWNAESTAEARSGVSTSLDSDPDGGAWMPIECDVSIRRPNWFWSTTNVRNLMTIDQLIEVYYRSVGRRADFVQYSTEPGGAHCRRGFCPCEGIWRGNPAQTQRERGRDRRHRRHTCARSSQTNTRRSCDPAGRLPLWAARAWLSPGRPMRGPMGCPLCREFHWVQADRSRDAARLLGFTPDHYENAGRAKNPPARGLRRRRGSTSELGCLRAAWPPIK
jgi:Alpha-L-fucosidase